MPNNRRRRFSVQKNISNNGGRNGRCENNLQISQKEDCGKENTISTKNESSTSADKVNKPEVLNPVESVNSQKQTTTNDKNVSADSSTIKLYNILSTVPGKGSDQGQVHRSTDRKSSRSAKREKHSHRAHVRSPKRKIRVLIPRSDSSSRTVGTSAIQWEPLTICPYSEYEKAEILIEETNSSIGESSGHCSVSRRSSHSEDMCRICHGGEGVSQELGLLISACLCRGTVGRVHVKCLERWLTESGKNRCELCGTRYMTRTVHRYGVPRGLVMWILSHNAKQLLVDSLGIMLMSPLAVLAAWLSGRTLAGLMTQDYHATPWPLASTFVLACMTLVCYYCWIVSAATRHALGWWVWYRAQYEVRLTALDSETA